jgi:hypothetical protein
MEDVYNKMNKIALGIIFLSFIGLMSMQGIAFAKKTTSSHSTRTASIQGTKSFNDVLDNIMNGFDMTTIDLCSPFSVRANYTISMANGTGDHRLGDPVTCSTAMGIVKNDCDLWADLNQMQPVCSDPRYQDWLVNYYNH